MYRKFQVNALYSASGAQSAKLKFAGQDISCMGPKPHA